MIATLRLLLAGMACCVALPALAAFTDNGDGTVTDTATRLMWDKCSWGQSNPSNCSGGTASTHTWSSALGVAVTANNASYRGYTDWRLPNAIELGSLIDRTVMVPAINTTTFPNTMLNWYWTSTTYSMFPDNAWLVNFYVGNTFGNPKTATLYVRLVRGGHSFDSFDSMADSTPDAFDIPDLNNQLVSTVVTTNAITVAGLGTVVAASTNVGTIVKNGTDTGLTSTSVVNGDTVAVRLTTSASYATPVNGALSIGTGVTNSDTFSVTTGAAPVNGACASLSGPLTSAPGSGLCTAGSATAVTANTGSYTWGCDGSNGGSSTAANACLVSRGYTVNVATDANSTVTNSGANIVAGGGTLQVTVTPASGYSSTVNGCGYSNQVITSSQTLNLTNIAADCSLTVSSATMSNGQCASLSGPQTTAPSAGLCSSGTATSVTSNAANYTWGCNGVGAGSSTAANACSVSRGYTVTASAGANGSISPATATVAGNATQAFTVTPASGYDAIVSGCGGSLSGNTYTTGAITGNCAVTASFGHRQTPATPNVSGGGTVSARLVSGSAGCSFDPASSYSASFSVPYNGGTNFPYGAYHWKLGSCGNGETVRVSVTFPSLAGLTVKKYGKTPTSGGASVWYTPTNLVISGNTASYDVTDGGLGDDDGLVDGAIVDPVVPIPGGGAAEIPTLSEWGLLLLSLLLAGGILIEARRKSRR